MPTSRTRTPWRSRCSQCARYAAQPVGYGGSASLGHLDAYHCIYQGQAGDVQVHRIACLAADGTAAALFPVSAVT
eukprot:6914949-Alexandrium_andersonii.AAC.1